MVGGESVESPRSRGWHGAPSWPARFKRTEDRAILGVLRCSDCGGRVEWSVGEDVDGNVEWFVGRFVEPAFDADSPGKHLCSEHRSLDRLIAGADFDNGKVRERRTESDVAGGSTGAGGHGKMQRGPDTFQRLVRQLEALEPLLRNSVAGHRACVPSQNAGLLPAGGRQQRWAKGRGDRQRALRRGSERLPGRSVRRRVGARSGRRVLSVIAAPLVAGSARLAATFRGGAAWRGTSTPTTGRGPEGRGDHCGDRGHQAECRPEAIDSGPLRGCRQEGGECQRQSQPREPAGAHPAQALSARAVVGNSPGQRKISQDHQDDADECSRTDPGYARLAGDGAGQSAQQERRAAGGREPSEGGGQGNEQLTGRTAVSVRAPLTTATEGRRCRCPTDRSDNGSHA